MDAETSGLIAQYKEVRAGQDEQPETMKELLQVLKVAGNNWREDHTTSNKNTGSKKVPRIPAREVANIIERHVTIAVIGDTSSDFERSPLYFYNLDTGIYSTDTREINSLILAVEYSSNKRARIEVRGFLQIEAPKRCNTKNKNLIPVGNGIYNRNSKQLEPFSSNYVFRSKISTNYVSKPTEPEFNGWLVSKWIEELSDHDLDKEKLIWQMIAATANSNYNVEAMFMLVDNGQGRTGKSTVEQLLMNLVGPGNYASLRLIEFEQAFLLAGAVDKALIIGDDNNPNDYNKTSANFKTVITGDLITINPKGMPTYSTRFNSVIVQSANGMPRFNDSTGGVTRRIRVIKFNHQYEATPAGKRIKDEYIKDQRLLEYVLFRALQVDLDKESLIETKESEEAVHELKLDSDPVAYFVANYIDDLKSTRIWTTFLFNYFLTVMARDNTPQSISQRRFIKRVTPLLESIGWNYISGRTKYLGEYWNNEDLKLQESLDTQYRYTVPNIDTHKYLPLFCKE